MWWAERCQCCDCAERKLECEYGEYWATPAKADTAAAAERCEIHLPAETWTEVLRCCGRISLAKRVCLARRLFHEIARPLIDGPPAGRVLRGLIFSEEELYKGTPNCTLSDFVKVPIAEVAPPATVAGFSFITLRYFNSKVLAFLGAIRHFLGDICLEFYTNAFSPDWADDDEERMDIWERERSRANVAVVEQLLRLFPRQEWAITSLYIDSGIEAISAELLAHLLTNVRLLRIQCPLPRPDTVELNSEGCSPCSPLTPVLVKWLHAPAEEGQLKIAKLKIKKIVDMATLITQAKEHFMCADSVPVAYYVRISSSALNKWRHAQLPFDNLHNERTGEALSLRFVNNDTVELCRRRCADLADAEAEEPLIALEQTFSQKFRNKTRNNIVLDIRINELSLSPTVDLGSEYEQTMDALTADEEEVGPSDAKKSKLDSP